MTHLDDDTLLQFILQILGAKEYEEARRHVAGCEQCRKAHSTMSAELARIGTFQLQVDLPEPPGMATSSLEPLGRWKWVIGLAAGFMLGFLTARMSADNSPIPVPQRLVPTEASASTIGFVSCRPVEVRVARVP